MPIAPVNNKGTVLFYEDSGAPKGLAEYTTIVLIHGLAFHGSIFRRLLPYAVERRLRLILLNTRDYPGSSRFTKEELERLRSTESGIQAAVVQVLGHELAVFLQYLVKNVGIPKITEKKGKRTGGLAVVAWSLGNLVSLSMLGNARSLPSEVQETFDRYLRTVVLYDASIITLGGRPTQLYSPLRDTNIPYEERGMRFCHWVSCYFPAVDDLDQVTESQLATREALHKQKGDVNPGVDVKPTLDRMSDIAYKSVVDPGVFDRSYLSLRSLAQGDTYGENLRKAIFDTKGVCRNVNVLVLWCNMSMSDCVLGAKHVLELSRKAEEDDGDNVSRRLEVVKVPNANHFFHWDNPEVLMNVLAEKL